MKLLSFLRALRYGPRRLARVDLELQSLKQRLSSPQASQADAMQRSAALLDLLDVAPGAITAWWDADYVDPSVRTALTLLCDHGDIAFDVGANVGTVSTFLSRRVGPTGRVIAFEASPRVLPSLSRNLTRGFCSNAYMIHAAVCERSNEQ